MNNNIEKFIRSPRLNVRQLKSNIVTFGTRNTKMTRLVNLLNSLNNTKGVSLNELRNIKNIENQINQLFRNITSGVNNLTNKQKQTINHLNITFRNQQNTIDNQKVILYDLDSQKNSLKRYVIIMTLILVVLTISIIYLFIKS